MSYHDDLDALRGLPPGTHAKRWRETVAAIYARLPYGPEQSPPFDPKSTRRHDRRSVR